ncbi:hypothetical protein EDB84DRAFT_1125055 [Lactarius hengduanensis]|nr:hypothetical protein EDB84DRAFT_1125055 [Lactarius hengduanensis]
MYRTHRGLTIAFCALLLRVLSTYSRPLVIQKLSRHINCARVRLRGGQKKKERSVNSIKKSDSRQDAAEEGVSRTTANEHSEDCGKERHGLAQRQTRNWRRPVLSRSTPASSLHS